MRKQRAAAKILIGTALLSVAQMAHAQMEDFEQLTWRIMFTIGAIPLVLSIPLGVQALWRTARRVFS